MASVHRLRNGMFCIQWAPREKSSVRDSSCRSKSCETIVSLNYGGGTSKYNLKYNCHDGFLKVKLTAQTDAEFPEKVTAILNGKEVRLQESDSGLWRYNWVNKSYPKYCYCWTKPNLTLILHLNTTSEEHILNHLSNLLSNKATADVHFVVQGKKIGAHQTIMVSASPVMEVMFQNDRFIEGISKTVAISDISFEAFDHLLTFVYTGRLPNLKGHDSMLEELFFAADKYQIQSLKDMCERKLAHSMPWPLAVHFLKIAHLHSAPKLLEASLKCIDENRKFIWDTNEWKEMIKEYPDLFFQASRRMAFKRPLED